MSNDGFREIAAVHKTLNAAIIVCWVVGIMLLEKQLLQMEDDGQSSHKRARTSAAPPSPVTTTWIELSKLVSQLLCSVPSVDVNKATLF